MDENASRAVFLGVSVFIAIITITIIVNFYDTARNSAAVANRFDISNDVNKNVNKVLEKKNINGIELRYLLNYFEGNNEFEIAVYNSASDRDNNVKINIDHENYWTDGYQTRLDKEIRPNYNYTLDILESGNKYVIVAVFQY